MFGYAKPVPVNFGRLNNPRMDMVWVALAGPAANIFLLVMSALFVRNGYAAYVRKDAPESHYIFVGRLFSMLMIVGAAIIGVALIAIFYSFGLRALLGSLQVESLAGRALIVVALLAPGSFLMGFPFPSMIRRLAGESRPLICWAWGFNSLASVIASIVAVMISMSWGFTATLMAGALGYVIAFGCLWTQTRSQSA